MSMGWNHFLQTAESESGLFLFLIFGACFLVAWSGIHDLRTGWMPDSAWIGLLALKGIWLFAQNMSQNAEATYEATGITAMKSFWFETIGGVVVCGCAALFLHVAGRLTRNTDGHSISGALGLGDVKLFAGIGGFLGPAPGFSVFLVSFLLAGPVLAVAVLLKKVSMKDRVPFGPFMAASFILSFVFLLIRDTIYPGS